MKQHRRYNMKKQLLNLLATALMTVAYASLIPPSRLNCYEPDVPSSLERQEQ